MSSFAWKELLDSYEVVYTRDGGTGKRIFIVDGFYINHFLYYILPNRMSNNENAIEYNFFLNRINITPYGKPIYMNGAYGYENLKVEAEYSSLTKEPLSISETDTVYPNVSESVTAEIAEIPSEYLSISTNEKSKSPLYILTPKLEFKVTVQVSLSTYISKRADLIASLGAINSSTYNYGSFLFAPKTLMFSSFNAQTKYVFLPSVFQSEGGFGGGGVYNPPNAPSQFSGWYTELNLEFIQTTGKQGSTTLTFLHVFDPEDMTWKEVTNSPYPEVSFDSLFDGIL